MPKHKQSKSLKTNRFSITLDSGYKYEQMSTPTSEFTDYISKIEHLETTDNKDLDKLISIQRKLGCDIMKQDRKVSTKERIIENLIKKHKEMHNNFLKKINTAKFDYELEKEKLELLKHQWSSTENGDKMGELISTIKKEFA